MSASNEWWDWHLTLHGWVYGTEKFDNYREPKEVEPPVDRVLTIRFHDFWPSVFKREAWQSVTYRHDNDQVVAALLEQYGPIGKSGGPVKGEPATVG